MSAAEAPRHWFLTKEQRAAIPEGWEPDEKAEQEIVKAIIRDAVLAQERETRKVKDIDSATPRIREQIEDALYCGDLVLTIPKPDHLIDGVLDMNSLAIMYGPSQSGKSFISLDMLLRVAAGFDWQGKAVSQGRCLYIAAEGTGDIGERVAAWKSQYRTADISQADFLCMPVNLYDAASVAALKGLVTRGLYNFIVIDTLARSMVGADENSAKDAAIVIAAADALRSVNEACVLLVHHSGYDATHARGSTAFRSASDTELSVKRTPDGLVILKAEKQKTRADGDKWVLALKPREDSLIVERAHDKPTDVTVTALVTLKALADNDDDTGLTVGQWQSVAGLARASFFRHRKALVADKLVTYTGKGSGARYSVTDEGYAALPASSDTEDAA